MNPSERKDRVAAREQHHDQPTADAVRGLVGRVADKTMSYRYYHWDWGEAIAMEGLWLATELTRTKRYRAFAERMVHGWIAHSPDPWYPDHVGPGRVLVEMWRATGELCLLTYAKALATHLSNLPRGRLGAFFHRPDLPDRAQMVWVDSMQTDSPFLCLLASATADPLWFDCAAEHVLGHVHALQDPVTNLFHHHYDEGTGRRNGVFWARGNGWATLGLVHCLALLPRTHPEYPAIMRSLELLASALLRAQDPATALWHTVVDHPDTYLEASASLLLSCGLVRAGRNGILPRQVAEAGARAWRTLWAAVDADGLVQNVSSRTPPLSDPTAYNRRPVGGHYPWGQGAYLLAAAASLGK
jgi:unsaturated rhamnogalacturonyl hydrolase